jgi:hypothetical protein
MTVTTNNTLIFRLTCWILGIVAFVQLIVAGVGLAMRLEQSREVKVVEKIISVPRSTSKSDVSAEPQTDIDLANIDYPPDAPHKSRALPQAEELDTPAIADPTVEKLVKEGREARIAENMMSAITKLEEAISIAPNEPNTLFELGRVYETMGIYDRASSYYQKVFELGTSVAGILYQQAATRLKDGFEQPSQKEGRVTLSRVRVFEDTRYEKGQKIVLTIPVQSVPSEKIDTKDLEVTVNFFDQLGVKKEIKEAATDISKIDYKWISAPIDWVKGEETLQVIYILPPQDVQDEHLFGERKYYGQVVELTYKGELIDAQAWPRLLARKFNKPEESPLFTDQENINPDSPLLPRIDQSNHNDLPPQDGYPLTGEIMPPAPSQ